MPDKKHEFKGYFRHGFGNWEPNHVIKHSPDWEMVSRHFLKEWNKQGKKYARKQKASLQ